MGGYGAQPGGFKGFFERFEHPSDGPGPHGRPVSERGFAMVESRPRRHLFAQRPTHEHRAVSPLRISQGEVTVRVAEAGTVHQGLCRGERQNRIVRIKTARLEKLEIFRLNIVPFVDGTNDVSNCGSEHGAALELLAKRTRARHLSFCVTKFFCDLLIRTLVGEIRSSSPFCNHLIAMPNQYVHSEFQGNRFAIVQSNRIRVGCHIRK